MFDVQDFIASCQQFVGAPDGTRRVLDLVRSVVGDAQGIKSAIVPGGDSPRAIRDLMLFRSPGLFILKEGRTSRTAEGAAGGRNAEAV